MQPQALVMSVQESVEKAERIGRAVSSAVDAKFAAASAAPDENPLTVTMAIRNKLSSSLKTAREPLREARFNISLIRTMIDCLEKQEQPPPSFPEPFASYLRTVILGAKAGLGNTPNLIAQLRDAATHAEAIYTEANKAFRRFDSATIIAAAKRTVEHLHRANRPEHKALIAALEKRVAHRTAVHRLLWPTRNPNRSKGRSK